MALHPLYKSHTSSLHQVDGGNGLVLNGVCVPFPDLLRGKNFWHLHFLSMPLVLTAKFAFDEFIAYFDRKETQTLII
jgi:hypothetical protein